MHLKDNFESGAPISQVPASWFNRVAKFINNLVGGENVTLTKHDDGSASVIDVVSTTDVTSDTPQAVASEAAVGMSDEAARADHVHNLNTDSSLSFSDGGSLCVNVENDGGLTSGSEGLYVSAVGSGDKWMKTDAGGYAATTDEVPITLPSGSGVLYSNGEDVSVKTVGDGSSYDIASGDHTHSEYAETEDLGTAAYCDSSEFAPAGSVGAVKSVNGKTGNVALDADDVGALDSNDIGNSVQAHSNKLDNLDANLNSDGTLPSSAVSDTNCQSGGDCFAYFNSNKKLGHLSYSTNTATVSNTNAVTADFNYDTSGSSKTAVLNYKAAGASAAPTTQKVIGFAARSATASLVDAAVFASGTTVEGGKFVKTDSNGNLAEATLTGSKWMMTDESGNPSTTDDTPIVASKSSTGVVYNAAGTISYKPLNSANGVAGLDSNSKLSIALIPTGATSSTVSVGNHTHSEYAPSSTVSFPGFGGTGSAGTASRSDHFHGNITNEGAITSSADHIIVGGSSGVLTYGSLTKPSGYSGSDLSLIGSVVGLFDYASGAFTLSTDKLKYPSSGGHTDDCFLVVGNDGAVTHSGNDMYNFVDTATTGIQTAPTNPLVLTNKTDGTIGWVESSATPVSPSSYTNMISSASTTDSTLTSTWTYSDNNNNGVKISYITRVIWTGTALKQFYRTLTFDKNGKLYNISAESQCTVDTPMVVSWS